MGEKRVFELAKEVADLEKPPMLQISVGDEKTEGTFVVMNVFNVKSNGVMVESIISGSYNITVLLAAAEAAEKSRETLMELFIDRTSGE